MDHRHANGLILDKEILALCTDRGSEHRVTYGSVHASLFCLALFFDVDMLIAVQTRPTQSWINPAEGVMSLLILALQAVALMCEKASDVVQAVLNGKHIMSDIRAATDVHKDLHIKSAVQECMKPMIVLLNQGFEMMKLKEETIKVYTGADETNVD